jgi:hypothetical protein
MGVRLSIVYSESTGISALSLSNRTAEMPLFHLLEMLTRDGARRHPRGVSSA